VLAAVLLVSGRRRKTRKNKRRQQNRKTKSGPGCKKFQAFLKKFQEIARISIFFLKFLKISGNFKKF